MTEQDSPTTGGAWDRPLAGPGLRALASERQKVKFWKNEAAKLQLRVDELQAMIFAVSNRLIDAAEKGDGQ